MKHKRKKHQTSLSESQKRLLNSYLDGGVTFIGRYRAEKLIDNSDSARVFCEEAAMLTEAVRQSCQSNSEGCCDIWKKVAQRIEAEERAEKYLGCREARQRSLMGNVWFGWYERFAWAFAGAGAVAALMMLTFNVRLSNNATRIARTMASTMSAPFSPANAQQVAFIPEGSQEARELSEMELDWVKSDGTWRLRQLSPEQGNSIIWVRRKPLSVARNNTQNIQNNFAQQQSRIPQGVPVSVQR